MSVHRKGFKRTHFQKQEKKYSEHCCVPLCSASSKFNGILSFHSFPTHSDWRRQWLMNIRRDPFTVTSHTKVCSRHFATDQLRESATPDGRRRLIRGAVPTLFEWNDFKVERVPPEEQEEQRLSKDHDYFSVPEPSASAAEGLSKEAADREFGSQQFAGSNIRFYTSAWTPPPNPDHDYAELPRPLENQVEEAQKVIREEADFQHSQFVLSRFQGDDKTVLFYSGFPDSTTLKAVFAALQPTAENMAEWSQALRLRQAEEETQRQGFGMSKLTLFDQFCLFLCRVRRGFPELDLAVCFSVSQSAVNRICVTWANFLHFMLGSLPVWPSRQTVNELMPPCFRTTFPHTRVILDCTDIHVQRPSSKVLNSETPSNYKSSTTFKGLIGISPSGKVTFVSDLYTGSISDREITQVSGLLPLLEEGDEVMADEGFLIKDLLSRKKVSLVIPPFLGPSGHFSPEEVRQTQATDRLCVHVERAIGRIKDYHIFDTVLPVTLLGSVNQLWTVCALLTNFQGPLF